MTDKFQLPQSVVDRFNASAGFDLRDSLVYLTYAGSKSHNTHVPSADPASIDDIDLVAVVVPPRERVYGLHRWDKSQQIQIDEWDVTIHSLHRFVELNLRGNPNIICTLWVRPSEMLHVSPSFAPFVAQRDLFSSRHIVTAFMGYASGQLKKATSSQMYQGYMGAKRKSLVDRFGFDPKNAAHMIRLLRMCAEFTETGRLQVWRTDDAIELCAIKTGQVALSQIELMVDELFARIKLALQSSLLAEEPDRDKAGRLLLDALYAEWYKNETMTRFL